MIFVLARSNARAFSDLDGPYYLSFGFKLFRRGETREVAASRQDLFWTRSVQLEINLEPGDYVVHVSVRL